MAFRVEYKYYGTWYDVSYYVLPGTGEVPYIARNKDYTLRSEIWNLKVSKAIKDVFSLAIDIVDEFRVYDGSTFLFHGNVETAEYNYETFSFDVKVRSSLGKLLDYKLDYNTLNGIITTGDGASWLGLPQWYDYSFGGYYSSVVGILWALKCCFYKAGLVLDCSNILGVTYFYEGVTAQNDFFGGVYVKYEHLFMDYTYGFWAVNQRRRDLVSVIDDPTKEYIKNKITLFKFVSEVFSMLGFVLIAADVNTFKIYLPDELYTITDNNKLAYSKRILKPVSTAVSIGCSYTEDYLQYGSAPLDNVVKSLGVGSELRILNNLEIYYSDAVSMLNHYVDVYCYTRLNLDLSYVQFPYKVKLFRNSVGTYSESSDAWNPLYYGYREQTRNCSEENIITPFSPIVKTVVEHFIDLERSTSRIIQETYS